MPLLRKDPFVPKKPSTNLKADDEVFVCKATMEAFTDYEEYFQRAILCNSLVWSCSLTGTYEHFWGCAVTSNVPHEKPGYLK